MSQESQHSSSGMCKENFQSLSNGENSTSSPREVSSAVATLTVVIRRQCLTWWDKSILVFHSGDLYIAYNPLGSSAKIDASHALPNAEILPLYSERNKRFHCRIYTSVPKNYTIKVKYSIRSKINSNKTRTSQCINHTHPQRLNTYSSNVIPTKSPSRLSHVSDPTKQSRIISGKFNSPNPQFHLQ